MSESLKIHHSNKYDSFQLIRGNRKIMPNHVHKLLNDPSFPEKFPSCPIIVDKNFNVIDGQHRLKAAKELGIPVYYIIDPKATLDDVVKRNYQVRQWVNKDFVNFYADNGNKSYIIIRDLMEKYAVPLSYLNSIITKLCNFKHFKYSYMLKDGDVNIEKYKDQLYDLCDKIFPALKSCRLIKGHEKTRPLFTDAYLTGYTHFYMKDPKLLERALNKMMICSLDFPYCGSFESGRDAIKNIAYWRKPRDKK